MTVISEPIENIAGADNSTPFVFTSYVVREGFDGERLITPRTTRYVAVGGVLTTDSLDPGPGVVKINGITYPIDIPDWPTPVRLWPLIEAGLPVLPSDLAAAVRNAGGVALIKVLTEAEYAALTATDPETLYIVVSNS